MNRTRKPKKLSTLLANTELQHDALLISKLNILLQTKLKKQSIQGCCVGNFKNGILTIKMASAIWKNRLEFQRSELLTLFRSQIPSITKMKFLVDPTLAKQTQVQKQARVVNHKRAAKMPEDVAQSFLDLAENAEPALKEALLSLAQFKK